jgi:serine/threonine-protein kinase HipA
MTIRNLQVRLRFSPGEDHPVGDIVIIGRDIVFQYDASFLASVWDLSPLHLRKHGNAQVHDGSGNLATFGVFEDAMPDSWGRRLMEQHFRSLGIAGPGVIETLAYVGTRGRGALTFHPPGDVRDVPARTLDLAGLAHQAWDFDDDRIENVLPELRRAAGTSGGARPKILVGFPDDAREGHAVLPGDDDLPAGYSHWIVKFNTRAEGPDAGPVEYAYARMAVAAGISMPEHRLIDTEAGRFFAVRRFDRPTSTSRLHLHSAAGLLHADFRVPGDEYQLLFRLVDRLTADYSQKLELFRRACMNVFACNRDDHLRNFAFLMDRDGTWKLSPLFDFTFHEGPAGWHTLSVAGEGEHPGSADLERLGQNAELRTWDIADSVERARAAISRFPSFAREMEISATTQARIWKRMNEIS